MKTCAVILSGCGHLDGAEIHEAVLSLLALQQAGFETHIFAPDIPQTATMNHVTREPVKEKRNCLVEAARIARGKIKSLEELDPKKFNALMIPGGMGAAMNLCDYTTAGTHCKVLPALVTIVKAFHTAKKPIGLTCIAPVIIAKIFESITPITLTLGSGPGANTPLTEMKMKFQPAKVDEMVADPVNRIYTTPCYMEPANLPGMYEGIRLVVAQL